MVQRAKNPPAMQETQVSLGQEDALEKEPATNPVFLPGEFPGQRHLVGYSPRSVKVAQLCLTLCDPMDSTVQGILPARILEWAAFPIPGGIFPTQGSNPGLRHCRQILYQLSYQSWGIQHLKTDGALLRCWWGE